MAMLSQAKTLGGVGSILVLLTAAPNVGWVLGIVGFVMTLFAVKYISEIVKDRSIFHNMLVSIGFVIGAIAVGTVVVIGAVFRVMGMGSFTGPDFVPGPNVTVGDWMAWWRVFSQVSSLSGAFWSRRPCSFEEATTQSRPSLT